MKKILSLFAIFSLFFISCSSDGGVGPQGPPGPAGPPGGSGLATIFEINSDFSYNAESNLWSTGLITFEDFSDVEVFETDIVLIYRLDAVGQLDDGSDVDEWSLLPQNFFTNDGTIQYVFNHTFVDTEIFIDGNYDLSALDSGFTADQIFRVAIIPADFYENARVDDSSIGKLMKSLDIQENDIIKINATQ